MAQGKRKKLQKGMQYVKDASGKVTGIRTFVRFSPTECPSKRWPLTALESELEQWLRDTRAQRPERTQLRSGTFAADVQEYLQRIAAVTSIQQKTRELEWWVRKLDGNSRSRHTIKTSEIEILLQARAKDLHRHDATRRIKPAAVLYTLHALQGFFTTMNGKGGLNPARAVTKKPRPPKPADREIPYAKIQEIIGRMQTFRNAKGKPPSLARPRVKVLAETTLTPDELCNLRPDWINWDVPSVTVPPRLKGEGVEAREKPLTPEGVQALQELQVLTPQFGTFNKSKLNEVFVNAAARCGVKTTLYALKHSILTRVYRETESDATTNHVGGHAENSRIAFRYRLGAQKEVSRRAMEKVSAAQAAIRAQVQKEQRQQRLKLVTSKAQKSPAKVTSIGKVLKRKALSQAG
jgi:integrase